MEEKVIYLEKIKGESVNAPVGTIIAGHVKSEELVEGKSPVIDIGNSANFKMSEVTAITDDTIVTRTAVYKYFFVQVKGESKGQPLPKLNTIFDHIDLDTTAESLGGLVKVNELNTHMLAFKTALAMRETSCAFEGIKQLLPTLTEKEIILLIGAAMHKVRRPS